MPEIAKMRYSHEALVDAIIASPGISQNELASLFGYTPAWISTIMSSNVFRDALAKRKEEIIDPMLTIELEDRFRALTARSLEVLQEKLSLPSSMVDNSLALKSAELGAKALGLGAAAQSAPPPPDYLKQLSERLLNLQTAVRPPQVIDGELA